MRTHFYVMPRYTGGSPGMVDGRQAQRVASDERAFYDDAMREPVIDPVMTAKAKQLGLGGIVEQRYETKGGWAVKDMLTHRTFFRSDKPAKKLYVGDIVTRYEDEAGNRQEGRWRVLDVSPGAKGYHRIIVRLEDKATFLLHESTLVRTEKDFVEGGDFRYHEGR